MGLGGARREDGRAEVLDAVRPFSADEIVRGQYAAGVVEGHEAAAYRDEERVAPESTVNVTVIHGQKPSGDAGPSS